MTYSPIDIASFVAFLVLVFGVSIAASRKKRVATEDYFLAGRELSWWLIGVSLIASNISTEHFVGLAGRGYALGLAIASYEWMAAVTMVVVALFFLPRFLRAGIFTMPEYLEYRYDAGARSIMAFFMMLAYVFVALATVLYSGALALEAVIGLDVITGIWIIGALSGALRDLRRPPRRGLDRAHPGDRPPPRRPPRVRALARRHRRLGGVHRPLRRQAPHRPPLERPRNALARRVRRRALDPEPLLLGAQPVHHPAGAGRAEPRRRPAGDALRRGHQGEHPVPDRHARHHGRPPLSRTSSRRPTRPTRS